MMNKYLMCLFYLALISACAVQNNVTNQNTEIPWEIKFRYRRGESNMPHRVLNLDETISMYQMKIDITLPDWKASPIIVVKYTGLSQAKVLQVYKRLKADETIEVLGMEQKL